MYESQKNYLKWKIRWLSLKSWTFPRKVEITIRELPQFHDTSPYFIYILMWFIVEGRTFRVGLNTGKDFYNLDEFPKAFMRAYGRTIKRLKREKKENGKRSHKR